MEPDSRAALVWSEGYINYRHADEHPMNPLRLRLTASLIEAVGAWPPASQLLTPEPASEADLAAVHTPDYIETVKRVSRPENREFQAYTYGLGPGDNPIFVGMHEAAALIAGGTLTGALAIAEGRFDHAYNFAGGLHHAMAQRASGFCIYNDAAVAIRRLLRDFNYRIAYVDIDVHHGDGVQALFYDDPRVLTISLHETGRHLFPGTGDISELGRGPGLGYAVNLPLEPFTTDASWLECFHELVPPLIRAFQPDLIISQHGCDTHLKDPLAHLAATTRLARETAATFHALAHEVSQNRWLALGGGGYDIWDVVPRAWTIVWLEMAGLPIPDEVPASWRARWAAQSPVKLPERFDDPPVTPMPPDRLRQIAERNRQTLRALKRAVFPIHGLPVD